jgi:hypothetical protein
MSSVATQGQVEYGGANADTEPTPHTEQASQCHTTNKLPWEEQIAASAAENKKCNASSPQTQTKQNGGKPGLSIAG